jgi:LPXTG-motif cell wall-anchored protein
MLFTLLDVPAEEPGFFARNSTLLIITAVVALLALTGIFLWRRKKRKAQDNSIQ